MPDHGPASPRPDHFVLTKGADSGWKRKPLGPQWPLPCTPWLIQPRGCGIVVVGQLREDKASASPHALSSNGRKEGSCRGRVGEELARSLVILLCQVVRLAKGETRWLKQPGGWRVEKQAAYGVSNNGGLETWSRVS